MQQVTEAQFKAVLAATEKENAERAEMGLKPYAIETTEYGAIGHDGSLVEYFWAGTLFGKKLNGIYYTNGI